MRPEVSPSDWKDPYTAAIFELDQEQILLRIHDAKLAICDRIEELSAGGKAAERIALNQAMKALSDLQAIYRGGSEMAAQQRVA